MLNTAFPVVFAQNSPTEPVLKLVLLRQQIYELERAFLLRSKWVANGQRNE